MPCIYPHIFCIFNLHVRPDGCPTSSIAPIGLEYCLSGVSFNPSPVIPPTAPCIWLLRTTAVWLRSHYSSWAGSLHSPLVFLKPSDDPSTSWFTAISNATMPWIDDIVVANPDLVTSIYLIVIYTILRQKSSFEAWIFMILQVSFRYLHVGMIARDT